jgi:hypothetical protein
MLNPLIGENVAAIWWRSVGPSLHSAPRDCRPAHARIVSCSHKFNFLDRRLLV